MSQEISSGRKSDDTTETDDGMTEKADGVNCYELRRNDVRVSSLFNDVSSPFNRLNVVNNLIDNSDIRNSIRGSNIINSSNNYAPMRTVAFDAI